MPHTTVTLKSCNGVWLMDVSVAVSIISFFKKLNLNLSLIYPSQKMNSKLSKSQETHLGNLLNQYIYAVIKDHNKSSDRLDPCASVLYQTYDNLMRVKGDNNKIEGTENRFNITSEVKQHMTHILRMCAQELTKIEITADDKAVSIIEKLFEEYNDDSIAASFLQLGVTYYGQIGETLKNTMDETVWLSTQIISLIPTIKGKLQMIAEITTCFDNSLRVCAWFIGRGVWFGAEKSITSSVFVNVLSMPTKYTFSLNVLDVISKDVREKIVRATKSKKQAAPVTEGTVNAAVAAATEGTVNTAVEGTKGTISTVEPQIITDDISKALEGI